MQHAAATSGGPLAAQTGWSAAAPPPSCRAAALGSSPGAVCSGFARRRRRQPRRGAGVAAGGWAHHDARQLQHERKRRSSRRAQRAQQTRAVERGRRHALRRRGRLRRAARVIMCRALLQRRQLQRRRRGSVGRCRLAAAAPPAALARAISQETHSRARALHKHAHGITLPQSSWPAAAFVAVVQIGTAHSCCMRERLFCVAATHATRNVSVLARELTAGVTHAKVEAAQRWSGRRESGHDKCTGVPVIAVSSSGSSRKCKLRVQGAPRDHRMARKLSTEHRVCPCMAPREGQQHRDAHERREAKAAHAPPGRHCCSLARASTHRSAPARRTRPARQQRGARPCCYTSSSSV
jgi:hypothetical protein